MTVGPVVFLSLLLTMAAALFSDYPTATLPTLWTNSPSLAHTLEYRDGSAVRPLLIRRWDGPSFAFAFFRCAACNAFLLSIVIVKTNSVSEITGRAGDPPHVVWSANRDRPVRENATIHLSDDGDLILNDADGTAVWSTNTSGLGATSLSLLSSGNLVLIDDQSNRLWASFDNPTDSWLLGQKLRKGQKLTANAGSSNYSRGEFYFTVAADGLRAYVDSYPPMLYYKSSLYVPTGTLNKSNSATYNNGSLDFLDPATQIEIPKFSFAQYIRLRTDGRLILYSWNLRWIVFGDLLIYYPTDCAHPTICGEYGICLFPGSCTCPKGANGDSSYFRPVDAKQLNMGCIPEIPLSCESIESHQLITLDDVSFFNYIDEAGPAIPITDVENCKQACLRNCSCKAAFFKYGRDLSNGSCYLPHKILSLMVNRQKFEYNSTAFLKVQQPTTLAPIAQISRALGSQTQKRKLVNRIMNGFLIAIAVFSFIFIVWVIRVRGKRMEEGDPIEELPHILARFSYEQVKTATGNFKQKLGQGGFGTVFMGILRDGTKVAVKRLDAVGQEKKEFLTEVKTIGSIHHINLVKLIGFCVEKSHRLLIFEYMPNGSLEKWIFGRTKENAPDWQTRRKIIIDIAKGVSYLHHECQQRIIHLDIKPQNILLDGKFNAKLADFGLSKLIDRDQKEIMTRMRGTPGYIAPEWLTSIITEKVDVYSFGVVVMEIICGRMNLDPSEPEESVLLTAMLQDKFDDNLLLDFFDKNCTDMKLHKEEVVKTMKLSILCLQSDCNQRPSMSMVVKALESFLVM